MKTREFTMAIAAMLLSAANPLFASSQHTWVAWFGNDSNAGTAASPFLTFSEAVSQTAPGGVVTALSAGDFGAVTISQAVTIEGVPGTSIAFTGSEGIYIGAGANDTVTLRGIHLNGAGVGLDALYFNSGAQLIVEDCVLENFTDIGIGIGSTTNQKVSIRNTTIHGGQLGFRIFQSSGSVPRVQASLENVTITGASSAAVFARNGVTTISNSVIAQSAIALEDDTSSQIDVQNTTISENPIAVEAYTTGVIRLSNCALLNNHTVDIAAGGRLVTDGNNRLSGNVNNGPAPTTKMVIE